MWRLVGGTVCWFALLALTGCILLRPDFAIDFAATPLSGRVPRLIDFTPIVDEDVVSYEWDFGDGTTSTEAAPAHTYREKGRFTVALRVQFADGGTAEAGKLNLIEIDPALPQAALAGELYWVDRTTSTINAGDREGHESRTVIYGAYDAKYLAVGAGWVYWTTQYRVERAELDGVGRETIFYPTERPWLTGVAVDDMRGKLYWISQPARWDDVGAIWKADLDGGDARIWATKAGWENDTWGPALLAIDAVNGRLYWFERYLHVDLLPIPVSLPRATAVGNCSVHWTGLEGFSDHLLFESLPDSEGLALDVGLSGGARYVYWTNPESDRVTRCRTDGIAYAWMLNNIDDPVALAVDAEEGKIYWSGSEGIHRANLDGTEQELIYPGVRADALALDL